MHNVKAQHSKNKVVGTRREKKKKKVNSWCLLDLPHWPRLLVRYLVIPVTLLWVEEVPPLPSSNATSLGGGD